MVDRLRKADIETRFLLELYLLALQIIMVAAVPRPPPLGWRNLRILKVARENRIAILHWMDLSAGVSAKTASVQIRPALINIHA